jgi:hypothetical protein
VETVNLVFQAGHARAEAFKDLPHFGRDDRAILAMVAGGGAAFEGVLKLFAAGATGAGTFTRWHSFF